MGNCLKRLLSKSNNDKQLQQIKPVDLETQNREIKYEFEKNDGIVKMTNGGKNNCLLGIVQILLEIDDLRRYLILGQQ